jgi:hypothetical protein
MCAFIHISAQLKLPAVRVSCGSSSCARSAPALYDSLQGSHVAGTRSLHPLT